MHATRSSFSLLALGILALAKTLACSGAGDDDPGISPSGGGSSSGGDASSADAPRGDEAIPDDGGGTIADDDGLVPMSAIWRTSTEWFRAIDTAPIAETSSEMIGALQKWGQTGDFMIDFSFNVLNGQGASTVTFPPDDEADSAPVPVPAGGYIEGDYPYDGCPAGDDCHLIVFDRGASRLYEVYQAHKNGNDWSGSLALWKLDKKYPRSNRGQGCTSADAAGLPIAPGLIGYKETKKGTIDHALRFVIRNDYIRGVKNDKNTPNVVYPASHGSTAGSAAKGIPYGGRLRLKATIAETDARIKTPGARAVVRALHRYGMILADGGNIPLVAESVKVHKDANPAETWDGLLGSRDLVFLRPSDFEVVAIPKDAPGGAPGWYQTKAEYEGQLQKPLGCDVVVQPE